MGVVGWAEAVALSVALTARRKRDNVIDTMAQRKLRKNDVISGAELAQLVLENTHKTMTKTSPGCGSSR